jgi:2-polyprenyl-3-methyl-5-hydroxy-6-metoxy-1,4-benzoquinol methylase
MRILELGAGDGSTAASLADLGHIVVAVDIVEECVAAASRLAREVCGGTLTALRGDFFEVDLGGPFDVVCYFDGFGVGADEDQRRLLRRIVGWLDPAGCALVDVLVPWYWAASAGTEESFPRAAK